MIDEASSKSSHILARLPQESVKGTLLFVKYINDPSDKIK